MSCEPHQFDLGRETNRQTDRDRNRQGEFLDFHVLSSTSGHLRTRKRQTDGKTERERVPGFCASCHPHQVTSERERDRQTERQKEREFLDFVRLVTHIRSPQGDREIQTDIERDRQRDRKTQRKSS